MPFAAKPSTEVFKFNFRDLDERNKGKVKVLLWADSWLAPREEQRGLPGSGAEAAKVEPAVALER